MTALSLPRELELNFHDQGTGPVLLLFNGATLPLEFWDPLVDRLADRYRFIRFDQRNAGHTVFNGTFTLNDTAADAAAVLDHLEVESVTLLGHAWGGRAAQVFARDYPHRTQRMIICGTGGQLPASVDPEILKAVAQAARERRRSDWEQALEKTYCAAGFSVRCPQAFTEISDLLWGKRPAGRARWEQRVSPSSSYWGSSKVRSLLVYGREDKNGTPENAQHLNDALANARLEFIEQAGHFLIRETPDQVCVLIEEFMQEDQRSGEPST